MNDKFRLLWKNVGIDDSEKCWNWNGTITKGGYGIIKIEGRKYLVHRVMFEYSREPIPKGLLVRHLCHNRRCCNPSHLAVGTHKENTQDSVKANRMAKWSKSPHAKVNELQVIEIRKLHSSGDFSQTELSRRFGISQTAIWHILNNNTWKDLR